MTGSRNWRAVRDMCRYRHNYPAECHRFQWKAGLAFISPQFWARPHLGQQPGVGAVHTAVPFASHGRPGASPYLSETQHILPCRSGHSASLVMHTFGV
ncbi:Opioid growth factor receptor [Plecturocebus cupreus]